jgi:hypothetical protein
MMFVVVKIGLKSSDDVDLQKAASVGDWTDRRQCCLK